MTYERKRLGRQKVMYDDANDDRPLVYQLVVDNAKVDPTSATISIYRPGSTSALVDADDMDTSSDRGDSETSILTYAVDTTTEGSWPAEKGYRADIVVTYGGVTYPRHLIFDVAKYIFEHSVTRDTMVGVDERISGMTFDGDEDLAKSIAFSADRYQAKLEAMILDAERLRLEWLIDSSIVDTAFNIYCVANVFRSKGMHDDADHYRTEHTEILEAAMSTYGYDDGESGSEGSEIGGITEITLRR